MKKSKLLICLVAFSLLIFSSCGKEKNEDDITTKIEKSDQDVIDKKEDTIVEIEQDSIVELELKEEEAFIIEEEVIENVKVYDFYKVVLSTDSILHLGETGILDVWIGSEEVSYESPDGTTNDETKIPKRIGKYAKISPEAQGFDVTGDDGKCYRIDESGSNVRFSLTPKTTGKFLVSAKVEMYKTEDCSDTPVPKYVERLSVSVKVDKAKEREKKVKELSDIVWENFKKFWGALVALIFGLLLFLIRRKIKRKTGYEETPPEE